MEEERKIEKWLRAFAKKRRGQAKDSFDLHPASRRLLHDEIARQAPAPEEEDDSLSLWEVLRRQWALLATFAACIFLVGIILLPVLNTAREKARHSFGVANLKQIGPAVRMSAAPTAASPELAANPASPPMREMTPPPGGSGATVAANMRFEGLEAPPAGRTAQPQFWAGPLNAFQNSIAPPQAVPVLSNFQVQQNGNALRIVDQDGSVYVGSWRLANRGAVNAIVEKEEPQSFDKQNMTRTPQTSAPPAMALAGNLQAAQNYFFRVHGMNRTLKQSVVFTGSLLANFALAGNIQQGFGGAGGGASLRDQQVRFDLTNQAAQLPWSSLRISGTAVIDRTNHVEVNAKPVAPAKQN